MLPLYLVFCRHPSERARRLRGSGFAPGWLHRHCVYLTCVLAWGCQTATPVGTTPEAQPGSPPAAEVRVAPLLERCGSEPSDAPRWRSFVVVQQGQRVWLDMVYATDAWEPAEPLAPLRHHGSRIELDNLNQFPALAQERGRQLRFTLELGTIDVRTAPDDGHWRSIFHAQIVRVCVL